MAGDGDAQPTELATVAEDASARLHAAPLTLALSFPSTPLSGRGTAARLALRRGGALDQQGLGQSRKP